MQFERDSVEKGVLRLEGPSRFRRVHISGHLIGGADVLIHEVTVADPEFLKQFTIAQCVI